MVAIPRDKILARRKKLAALQAKVKQEEQRLAALDRKRHETKLKIIGRVFEKRMSQEPELKAWFDHTIDQSLRTKSERDVFDLSPLT